MHDDFLGGAGYVIYVTEGGWSQVVACRSVALPHCSDNIEAEITVVVKLKFIKPRLHTQGGHPR